MLVESLKESRFKRVLREKFGLGWVKFKRESAKQFKRHAIDMLCCLQTVN